MRFEAQSLLPIIIGLALTGLLFLLKLACWQDRSKISSLTAGAEFPIDATSTFLGMIVGAPAIVPVMKDAAILAGLLAFVAVIVQVLCFRVVNDNRMQYAQFRPAAKIIASYVVAYGLFFACFVATIRILSGAPNAQPV